MKMALLSLFGFVVALIVNIIASILLAGFDSIRNFPAMLRAAIFIQTTQNEIWSQPLTSISAYLCIFLAIFAYVISKGVAFRGKMFNFHVEAHRIEAGKKIDKTLFYYAQFLIPIIFGLAWHEIIGGVWLSYSFYAALYLPLILFFIAGVMREASLPILYICFTLQIVFMYGLNNLRFQILERTPEQIRVFTFILILCILINPLFFRFKIAVSTILLTFLLCIAPINQTWGGFIFQTKQPLAGEYIDFAASWKNSYQEDVQSLALKFARYVQQKVPKESSLWVVYPNEKSWLTSIVSTQQYGYSCFHCTEVPPKIKNNSDLLAVEKYSNELALRSYTVIMTDEPIIKGSRNLFQQSKQLQLVGHRIFKEKTVNLYVYLYKSQKS
jgi:hypothetical protein